MTGAVAKAFYILGQFWLAEVRPQDLAIIAALPELAETLPEAGSAALTGLAVEYQRLFGFNLPPFESVFVDPSAMLMAPATSLVQALYRRAGWTPPPDTRAGAADHLGLELLALAEWLDHGPTGPAQSLITDHLALWVPPFVLTLRRLNPHPFYVALAALTLNLLLTTLPAQPQALHSDPFPRLPPPPVYTGSRLPGENDKAAVPAQADEMPPDMRDVVKRLLTPCQAGLFITRQDIAGLSRALNLPGVVGERRRMLQTLFRQVVQYDLTPALLDQLSQLLNNAGSAYQAWAGQFPNWTRYGQAWCSRLADTQAALNSGGRRLESRREEASE